MVVGKFGDFLYESSPAACPAYFGGVPAAGSKLALNTPWQVPRGSAVIY